MGLFVVSVVTMVDFVFDFVFTVTKNKRINACQGKPANKT